MTVACSSNVETESHTKRIVPSTHISTLPGRIRGSVTTTVHGQVLQHQPQPMPGSPPQVIRLSATMESVIHQGSPHGRSTPVTNSTFAKRVNNASMNALMISSLTHVTIFARRKARALHALTLVTRTHWIRSSLILKLSICLEISFQ